MGTKLAEGSIVITTITAKKLKRQSAVVAIYGKQP